MKITTCMTVRHWAALDVALTFFRMAPPGLAAAQRLARHCRRLHVALRQAGVSSRYIPVGTETEGKSLLRLHVKSTPPTRRPLPIDLPHLVVRTVARACLTILEVQTDPTTGSLLDHEAEELQAVRAFLSELRRQSPTPDILIPERRACQHLRWDERHGQYVFTAAVAQRIHQYYLRAGVSLN
jgi:hypothetical protein